jgi:hypothetical protein
VLAVPWTFGAGLALGAEVVTAGAGAAIIGAAAAGLGIVAGEVAAFANTIGFTVVDFVALTFLVAANAFPAVIAARTAVLTNSALTVSAQRLWALGAADFGTQLRAGGVPLVVAAIRVLGTDR